MGSAGRASSPGRADRVSAWMVGVGIGLITLMLTWLVGNRLTALVWEAPVGPTIAFAGAILAGITVSLVMAVRLDRSQRR